MPVRERSREQLRRALEIFEEALERPPDERPAFLEEACRNDASCRRLVEEMLAADSEETGFVDRPVLEREKVEPVLAEARDARRIGPYRLLRRIGQGGMGTVYLAVRDDDTFDRRVVIKLARHGFETEDLQRRLKIERRILASLDHPNIARIYDGGTTDDGLPYFVMEYIEGEPIDTYCDRNRLTVDERLGLMLKICSAVRLAHQNLVVHRDLKPSNILVTPDGEPKLLDFGIAKVLNPDLFGAQIEPTLSWQRMLTPHYASPEQIRGEAITTTSDVYSLGVLLYKLLTGSLPFVFETRSTREIERILTTGEPRRPSHLATEPAGSISADDLASARRTTPRELSRRLSGDLDSVVLKALRPVARERYAFVGQLSEDLERYLRGLPVSARRGTWRYRAVRFARANRTAVAVAALVMALPLAFAGGMAIMLQRVAAERDQVVVERNRARVERDRAEEEKRRKEVFLDWVLGIFTRSDPFVSPEEHSRITVREALDRSLLTLENEAHEDPALRAEMRQAIGQIYHNLNLAAQAAEQVGKALKIRQALHGPDHLDVVRNERVLAAVLKEQDTEALNEADQLSARALDRLDTLVGRDHPYFLEALNTRTSVLCYRSNFRQAEPLAEEAVRLSRELGVDDSNLGSAIINLATTKLSIGRYDEAVDLYRQALELTRSIYGPDSPWLAAPAINLGIALRRLDRFEEAAESYRMALAIQVDTWGEDHFDLFPTLFNLARLLQADGRHREALLEFDRAEAILHNHTGPEHPHRFMVDLRRQESRFELGELDAVTERLRASLATWRPRLGPSHTSIALAESLLGQALGRQGHAEEAERLLVQAYRQLLETGRHRHQEEALNRLAELLEKEQRDDELREYRSLLAGGESSA